MKIRFNHVSVLRAFVNLQISLLVLKRAKRAVYKTWHRLVWSDLVCEALFITNRCLPGLGATVLSRVKSIRTKASWWWRHWQHSNKVVTAPNLSRKANPLLLLLLVSRKLRKRKTYILCVGLAITVVSNYVEVEPVLHFSWRKTIWVITIFKGFGAWDKL